jgi:hemerythrin-like domain-containing protein
MADTQISEIMVAQHHLIEALFEGFRDELKTNVEAARNFYAELVWEVKKHFFIEEQAIFDLLPWKDPEVSGILTELKNEHRIMAENLDKIENLGGDESGFTAMMKGHVEKEEKKLYPMLDERLTPEEKQHIISRIGQIPLNKF